VLVLLVVAQVEPASTVENQQVEDPPSMKFTWTIENFTRLNTKKHYSEVFIVGGYKWYLNFTPLLNLCIRAQRTLICVVL
jgi:ubiquitin carboxyl-terminal hydrolase 7